MDNHEFLRGFAQLVKEANIDNLCADFSRGHMFVTTIKPCARLAPERSEAAKKLADAFTPYWVQTIQKLRHCQATLVLTPLTTPELTPSS